jgi:uncharacterized protein (DUF1800 family)
MRPALRFPRWSARHHTPTARLLLLASAISVSTAAQAQPAGREQTADQQVQHVLNRLAFGARPGDVERVRSIGVDAWIESQLHPERIDDRTLDTWLTRFPTISMSGEALIAKYPPPGQTLVRIAARQQMAAGGANAPRGTPGAAPTLSREDSLALAQSTREAARVTAEISAARVARAVASERQLQEVMTEFWANHFSVFTGKQQTRYYIPEYDALLRTHALGSFRELLGAVAHSGAMLYYLDQWQSVADSGRRTLAQPRIAQVRPAQRAAVRRRLTPEQQQRLDNAAARRPRGINENYARELMELHTLGVDGGYTQQDVMEVARALTGWTLTRGPQGGGFQFRPEVHDAEAKTILGQSFPAGRGEDEGERVLDLLASHPSTARFIATKLARRFVSDEPPAALVDRAAATFTRTKGDLREVLRTIITSDEFFADAAFRAKVKTPFELVVSASRALGGQPDATPMSAQLVARLGQPIYGRQTPDGYPDVADEWINTGAILNRMNFGLAVGANRIPGARVQSWSVAKTLSDATDAEQVDGLVRALFGGIVSPDTRDVLLSGTNPLLAQAGAGADSLFAVDDEAMMTPPSGAAARRRVRDMTDPAMTPAQARQGARRNPMATLPALTGFPKLVGLAIGAPEFQRR